MSEPPRDEPRISADGKFYWDGQRWAPLPSAASSVPTAPPKRSYPGRGLVIGCLGILVLGAIAIFAVGALHGLDHTLTGTMTLHERVGSGSCTGTGGYDDIHAGTAVVVKDEGGKVLATGSLGPGQVQAGTCVFDFSVSGVSDANFYQVEVSHRGNVTYSKSQLESNDWHIDVELGA